MKKQTEIEFDAEALVGSVEAFAARLRGHQKLTLRTTHLKNFRPQNRLEGLADVQAFVATPG